MLYYLNRIVCYNKRSFSYYYYDFDEAMKYEYFLGYFNYFLPERFFI